MTFEPYKVILLVCPTYNSALVASQELIDTGLDVEEWSIPKRQWPQGEKGYQWLIPDIM
jgi:hypothetical protein